MEGLQGAVDSDPEVGAAVAAAVAESGGRIPYTRFLEICLYHPERGYYASFGLAGAEGAKAPESDYFTSVDLHPAFGRILSREVGGHLDRVLAEGAGLAWVVEIGAGRGLLARDILQALAAEQADLLPRVRYVIVEPNAGWAAIQRKNLLPDFEGTVRWVRSRGPSLALRRVRGAIVSNELFDALPFHVVEGGPDLVEVFVASGGGGFVEEKGALSDARIGERLTDEGIRLSPGQRAEVCLGADALAREMARALAKGTILVVDYGDQAAALYDPRTRPEGTMRCFYHHRRNDEPLSRLGRQDITASVDFTALARALEDGGAKVRRVERQGEFLARHGLDGLRAKLERDGPGLPREVYVRHRRALEALADPKGLGSNLVLVAWR